jgi:hypothetical protein
MIRAQSVRGLPRKDAPELGEPGRKFLGRFPFFVLPILRWTARRLLLKLVVLAANRLSSGDAWVFAR